MVVPCMVNSRLKTCGETTLLCAAASCIRMIVASIPPTTRNTRAYPIYIRPSRLWSTVVTHSWSLSTNGREASWVVGQVIRSVAIGQSPRVLAKRFQVSRYYVQVVLIQSHRRHERAGLHRVGISHPSPQVVVSVYGDTRSDRVATHQVREVRTEAAFRSCTRYNMAA